MTTEQKSTGISELLGFALKNKASDLHITSGQEPMLRIDGELVPIKFNPPSKTQVFEMLKSIMTKEQLERYEKAFEIDFAINYGMKARFRVNAFFSITGPSIAFRSIPIEVPKLENINAPKQLFEFSSYDRGLVLVTGPTGSGKSTTLAAMIDYINENRACHILTIEDPVEFIHKPKKSLINQREVTKNTKSFASALKNALREDPDVILIGEMRDLETISLALTAAETGHLVFGTLHTSSASKTINRIIDVFPNNDKDMARSMLASSLKAIVAQRLLPANDGGRIAVHEILVATPAIANLIREDEIHQIDSMMQVKKEQGMQTMNASLETLILEGKIAPDEARKVKNQPIEKKEIDLKQPPIKKVLIKKAVVSQAIKKPAPISSQPLPQPAKDPYSKNNTVDNSDDNDENLISIF